MTDKEYKQRHSKIEKLISEGSVRKAVAMLESAGLKGDSINKLQNSAGTYNYMLNYYMQSTPESCDPARNKMYSEIKEELLRLNDMLLVQSMQRESSDYYFSRMRTLALDKDVTISGRLSAIQGILLKTELADETGKYDQSLHHELEAASSLLFDAVWTTPHISDSDIHSIMNLISDDEAGENGRCVQALMIAALFLGCIHFYDRNKLKLLLEVPHKIADSRLSARALTCALLIIWKYESRVSPDAEITDTASALAELPDYDNYIRSFVLNMLRTIDTDRINKKMREELLPEIMKLKPNIEKHLKAMGDVNDIVDMEDNPDWKKLLDNSGITEKIKSFTEIQMDGGDVFMSAFSQMKSFPFFRNVSNWFIPFTKANTSVARSRGLIDENVFDMLLSGPHFCSSDKYSMTLALAAMPRQQLEMMSGQLSAQFGALEEERKTSFAELVKLPMETEINLFLKDLFRFFRLSPVKDEIADLFADSFFLPSVAPYSILGDDTELLRAMAEFYFKYGYWDQASRLFEYIAEISSESSEELLQKLGYCYQQLSRHSAAMDAYRKAELLNPSSVWLLRHLGSVLRATGRFEQAAEYYLRASQLRPDNRGIEMSLAHIYVESGKIEEALKIYYKWDYLEDGSPKISRAIAWCEFLSGNFEKSIKRYHSLGERRTLTDKLNTGHALLALARVADATDEYRQVISGSSYDEFCKQMREDRQQLVEAGVDAVSISLVMDGLA